MGEYGFVDRRMKDTILIGEYIMGSTESGVLEREENGHFVVCLINVSWKWFSMGRSAAK